MGEKGFTLLEMVIALAVGTLLTAAMYSVFTSNNKAVAIQMRKAEIQQNLRASFFVIETEIKRIGFNPMNLQGVHAPHITSANKGSMSFQADLNENGKSFSVLDTGTGYDADVAYSEGNITPATDPDEVTTLSLGSGDTDDDGVPDSPPASLIRGTINENGNLASLVIANNIEVLDFVYLDQNGDPVNGSPEDMEYPIVDPLLLSDIKKIQVTIIVRSSTERRDYKNSHNYFNTQGQELMAAQNDGYDRTLLTKTIDCRNLGLL